LDSSDIGSASDRRARYELMRLSRRFEETVHEQFHEGNVPGPLHLSIGQEAVAVGGCWPLRETDVIVSTHRGHHHCLAKGARADRMMAELLGRADGYSRGRGGSMHVAIPEIGLLGTNGIVGGGIPIGTGAALGLQIDGRDDVAVCFFGEGAAANGVFGEALNTASLWKLPIVFICENNQYSMGTPLYRTLAVPDVTERAAGYAVARDRFDGDDVLRVRERIGEAVARARKDKTPTLVEVITYRFRGHSMSDPGNYRTKDEIEEWKKRDPVPVARDKLKNDHGVTEDELVSLEASIKAEVQEAVRFAEESPPADPTHLWDYVYADASTDPRKM
jgi:TPP-dependent pyruvate/acetoin dehydrogenase alpha subunit